MSNRDMIVELAEEALDEHGGASLAAALFDRVLHRGADAASSRLGPAEAFDTWAEQAPGDESHGIEVVARPGEPARMKLEPGDVVLRRALGEGRMAHVAVVANGRLHHAEELSSLGLQAEGHRPGLYAEVVEGGVVPHRSADHFARRLLDEYGNAPPDTLIIRATEAGASIAPEQWGEAIAFTATRFVGNARLLDALNDRGNIKQRPGVDPANTIIQQALVDLGYTLPRHGVDGRYGSETKAAVRLFQTEQKTRDPSFKVEGVVGPQTMARLDAIFAVLDAPCSKPTITANDPSTQVLAQPSTIIYDAGTVTVLGLSIEIKGTIVYPADAAGSSQPFSSSVGAQGRTPVVIIAHGNHSKFHDPADRNSEACTRVAPNWVRIASHDGYPYLQQMLARLGIISVSVDAHQTQCRGFNPTNMRQRAGAIVEAIRHLQTLDASGSGSPLEGHVDFSRIGLLGHSRGGEAVVATPAALAAAGAPVNAAQIVSIVSLAPTNVGTTTVMPTVPFMSILPAGDGDVVDNSGAEFYDSFRPSPFKCQLYVHRANHNRFNREWPVDDRLSGAAPFSRREHERLLEIYGAAFFRQTLFGEDFNNLLRGVEVVAGVPNDQVFVSHEHQAFITIDDHEAVPAPPAVPIATNTVGGATAQAGTLTAAEQAMSLPPFPAAPTAPDRNYPGDTRAMLAQSPTAYGTFRSALATATNLTNREVWIRAGEVYDGTSVPAGATRFQVGVEDSRGRVAFVASGDLARPFDRRTQDLAALGIDVTKTMFQTIRIPQRCLTLARPGVDMTRIRALVLRLHGPAGRRLVFDMLQVSPV